MFRRFFDPAAAETKAEPRFQFGESLSLEDVLQGVPAVEEKVEEKKEEKAEVKVEEKAEPEVKVEQPKEEKKEQPATLADWREEVKKNAKEAKALLEIDDDALAFGKEVSSDEFVKKLVAYRKENGNVTPFIDAATKDWDKVSHEQLIMDELKQQYSKLSPDKAEKLAKSEYDKRFSYKDDPLLSDDENRELAELQAIKLEAEGEAIRDKRKETQKQFLDSVKPIDKTAAAAQLSEEQKKKAQEAQQEALQFKTSYESHPATAKLFTDKQIVFGDKDTAFNYTVNPDAIKEQALDFRKFDDLFWVDNGKGQFSFDAEKWNKVAAYAADPIKAEMALINHGRSLENKQIVEKDLSNAKEPGEIKKKDPEKKSLAKAFVENGQPISLEELYGG